MQHQQKFVQNYPFLSGAPEILPALFQVGNQTRFGNLTLKDVPERKRPPAVDPGFGDELR